MEYSVLISEESLETHRLFLSYCDKGQQTAAAAVATVLINRFLGLINSGGVVSCCDGNKNSEITINRIPLYHFWYIYIDTEC